jgi:hypothetical protein
MNGKACASIELFEKKIPKLLSQNYHICYWFMVNEKQSLNATDIITQNF